MLQKIKKQQFCSKLVLKLKPNRKAFLFLYPRAVNSSNKNIVKLIKVNLPNFFSNLKLINLKALPLP